MTQEEHKQLDFVPIEQARPIWKHRDYFTNKWKEFPVTFVVCQKNTKHFIQLCLESLLRFYPDVNILVVDDNSEDDSVLYLRYMELHNPNIILWERKGEYIGHGDQLHLAITEHIETEYAMIMDSDVIIERGGFVEEMLQRFSENKKLYAIGTIQPSSYANNGDEPIDLKDTVRYANPQMSLYHVPTYHELVEQGTDSKGIHRDAPFITDGTPCILNMKAARDANLDVETYPVDLYVSHNSGSSWVKPRTVWLDDHDVKVRPFLTILISQNTQIGLSQEDYDYDLVVRGKTIQDRFSFTDGTQPFDVNSKLFPIRFNVHGEYVIDLTGENIVSLPPTFIQDLKNKVNEEKVPNEVNVNGLKCYKREFWQSTIR